MYRFILFYFVLYICIYVAPWSCEARHLVPLYVHTCSGMTIKLNLNLNLNQVYALTTHQLQVERRESHMALFYCMVRHGTVQYGSLLGGFPLAQYLVPGTFLVPPRPRFQAIRTITKT